MDQQSQFCQNPACSARGKVRKGNIVIHSRKEKGYRCKECGKTFSETKGTFFYRLQTSAELFTIVITLIAYGCPVQAIVAAFGLAEETVRSWLQKAGKHCQKVHEHTVCQGKVDLGQVQADEIKVKIFGQFNRSGTFLFTTETQRGWRFS